MNHKKAWSVDDKVMANLSFPQLPTEQLAQPYSEYDLISGVKYGPATDTYKYRCVKCGGYYDSEVEHSCKK